MDYSLNFIWSIYQYGTLFRFRVKELPTTKDTLKYKFWERLMWSQSVKEKSHFSEFENTLENSRTVTNFFEN